MKLVLTDSAGNDHDVENVILGIAADIHRLNQRLIRIESELNISYETAEETEADAEE